MGDNWDDSDDDWDKSDDELDARLNQLGINKKEEENIPKFDDEEDLAIKEKAENQKVQNAELRKKGKALAEKKKAEKDRKDEEEVARKAMEVEAELESNMSPAELRAYRQEKMDKADDDFDVFGSGPSTEARERAAAGGTIVLKDLKDHLKHARKVADCVKSHKNVHFASTFVKETIQQCKDILDDAAITDIIKTCNVIKNEKVQAAKRKVKGQAQKSAKRDKAAEAKARQLQVDLFGDNDQYDEYDEYGEQYEDAFF